MTAGFAEHTASEAVMVMVLECSLQRIPSKDSCPFGEPLKRGDAVNVQSIQGDWAKVSFGQSSGYLPMHALQSCAGDSGSPSDANEAEPAPEPPPVAKASWSQPEPRVKTLPQATAKTAPAVLLAAAAPAPPKQPPVKAPPSGAGAAPPHVPTSERPAVRRKTPPPSYGGVALAPPSSVQPPGCVAVKLFAPQQPCPSPAEAAMLGNLPPPGPQLSLLLKEQQPPVPSLLAVALGPPPLAAQASHTALAAPVRTAPSCSSRRLAEAQIEKPMRPSCSGDAPAASGGGLPAVAAAAPEVPTLRTAASPPVKALPAAALAAPTASAGRAAGTAAALAELASRAAPPDPRPMIGAVQPPPPPKPPAVTMASRAAPPPPRPMVVPEQPPPPPPRAPAVVAEGAAQQPLVPGTARHKTPPPERRPPPTAAATDTAQGAAVAAAAACVGTGAPAAVPVGAPAAATRRGDQAVSYYGPPAPTTYYRSARVCYKALPAELLAAKAPPPGAQLVAAAALAVAVLVGGLPSPALAPAIAAPVPSAPLPPMPTRPAPLPTGSAVAEAAAPLSVAPAAAASAAAAATAAVPAAAAVRQPPSVPVKAPPSAAPAPVVPEPLYGAGSTPDAAVCWYFALGRCNKGLDCRWVHNDSVAGKAAAERELRSRGMKVPSSPSFASGPAAAPASSILHGLAPTTSFASGAASAAGSPVPSSAAAAATQTRTPAPATEVGPPPLGAWAAQVTDAELMAHFETNIQDAARRRASAEVRGESVGAVLRIPAAQECPRERAKSIGPPLVAAAAAAWELRPRQLPTCQLPGAAAAPRSTMRSVSLVTFGIEKLDEELAEEAFVLGGGARARIEEPVLRTALQRSNGFRADVIVDARQFPDPDCFSLRGHTGNNPEIISRIVRHRNFRRWLGALKADFLAAADERAAQAEAEGSGHVEVGVAVYCKSGKHRSVAGGIVLKYILEAERWPCREIRHLSRKTWGYRCCQGLCPDCLEKPPALQETLVMAREVWLSLPCDGRRYA